MNERGVSLLKSFESCRLRAYPDPGTGGAPWTIGYGATGEGIGPGVVWTQAEAEQRLAKDLERFEMGVRDVLQVELNEDQVSALTDFAYNEGLCKLTGSTLLKRINSGDFDVEGEFKKWVYAGGHKLEGLVGRRAAESCLFNSDYAGLAAILDAR